MFRLCLKDKKNKNLHIHSYIYMYEYLFHPTVYQPFFNKRLIFFLAKYTRILSFLVEQYTIKIDIIRFYL